MTDTYNAPQPSTSATLPAWRIDLYSDTQTRPTKAMYEAMHRAPVGDEQSRLDPTTNALEERLAALLGKEAAVFLPSGTMANLIAAMIHTERCGGVVCHAWSHIFLNELGGVASVGQALVMPVHNTQGTLTPNDVATTQTQGPPVRMVSIEQTFNSGGGSVLPLPQIEALYAYTQSQPHMALHIDGARLLNATVATGIEAATYGGVCDTLWLDFTKGLGCPVGAGLAGSAAFIEKARFWKKVLGGAMRQSGVIAAAALHALEHHVARLADDHAHAQLLAQRLRDASLPQLDIILPQTNMVFVRAANAHAPLTTQGLAQALATRGIRTCSYWRDGTLWVRMVTHLDVTRADVEEAAQAVIEIWHTPS